MSTGRGVPTQKSRKEPSVPQRPVKVATWSQLTDRSPPAPSVCSRTRAWARLTRRASGSFVT